MAGRGKSDPEPDDTWLWVCIESAWSKGAYSWQSDEIHQQDWETWAQREASFEIIPGKLRVGGDGSLTESFLFIHRSLTGYAK